MAFSFFRTITLKHGLVGGSDSANFPMLFSGVYPYLAGIASGGSVHNLNGDDIVFTSDAAGVNFLKWEIESYDPSSGSIVAWVNVPNVSYTADTVVYLHYSDATINTFQGGPQGSVWDSNYQAVFHFPSGSLLKDSSQNNLGVSSGGSPTATPGEIGGGINFAGASDAQSVAFNDGANAALVRYPLTVEFWMKPGASQGPFAGLFGKYVPASLNGWLVTADEPPTNIGFDYIASGSSLILADGANGTSGFGTVASLAGKWTHCVAVITSAGVSLYANGALLNTTPWTGTPTQATQTTNTRLGGAGSGSTYYAGSLDEVRISSTARSADWITASYNNQFNPAGFYTLGAEQDPLPQPPSIREQIMDELVAALSTGSGITGLSVHRERTRPIEIDSLPAIMVYADDDVPKPLALQTYRAPLTERQFSVALECRAQGSPSVSPDEALDPVLVWALKAIGADETLGGLASGVEEGRTVWSSREGDVPVASAKLNLTIRYRTSRLDPTSKS